ncbi:MAG: helix-turn-helix domain-containing protein [Terriglobia bacterium]
MPICVPPWITKAPSSLSGESGVEGPLDARSQTTLVSASSALNLIRHRTSIPVARATFYRWLNNGRIFSCRLGQKLYVPMSVVDETVRKCRSGERL